MDSAKTWRVVSASSHYWHAWDGEYLVYNDRSGDTHFLTDVAARLLHGIEEQPMGLRDMIALANQDVPGDEEPWSESEIMDMVLQFEGFGLIEPAAS